MFPEMDQQTEVEFVCLGLNFILFFIFKFVI